MKKDEKLVDETLAQASEYMDRLIEGIKNYLNLLYEDNFSSASKMLINIVEGLEWEFDAIRLMQEELTVKFELQECKEVFKQLSESVQNNDRVAISDLFEYEIVPMLEKWDTGLKEEVSNRGL